MSLEDHRKYMELAFEEARKCIAEDDGVRPKVGAVIVKDGKILGKAFRGEIANGQHAEYTLLEEKLSDVELTGSTLYTTLEPCTHRNHPKRPCCDWIIDRRIAKVFVGTLDPNPTITGIGQRKLITNNIDVQTFEFDITKKLEELNRDFTYHFENEKELLEKNNLVTPEMIKKTNISPHLIVICGASTAGKDTILARVRSRLIDIGIHSDFLNKYTTREERPGEKSKSETGTVDTSSKYNFLSEEIFQSTQDIFGQYVKYGKKYGFSEEHLKSKNKEDKLLFCIHGDLDELEAFCENIEEQFQRKTRIYIIDSDLEDIYGRLDRRRGISDSMSKVRRDTARFDYNVIRNTSRVKYDKAFNNSNESNPDKLAEELVLDLLEYLKMV